LEFNPPRDEDWTGRSAFPKNRSIGFLHEAEAGVAVKDLCRRHGFSEASYYLWHSKFGGMGVSEAKRLKELEAEEHTAEEAAVRAVAGERRHQGRPAKKW